MAMAARVAFMHATRGKKGDEKEEIPAWLKFLADEVGGIIVSAGLVAIHTNKTLRLGHPPPTSPPTLPQIL